MGERGGLLGGREGAGFGRGAAGRVAEGGMGVGGVFLFSLLVCVGVCNGARGRSVWWLDTEVLGVDP